MNTNMPKRRFHVEPLEERVVPVTFAAVFTRATVGGGNATLQVAPGPNGFTINANVNAGIGTAFGEALAIEI